MSSESVKVTKNVIDFCVETIIYLISFPNGIKLYLLSIFLRLSLFNQKSSQHCSRNSKGDKFSCAHYSFPTQLEID